MNITTLGIDIAKNVFQLHGIDNNGKTILTQRLSEGRHTKGIFYTPSFISN